MSELAELPLGRVRAVAARAQLLAGNRLLVAKKKMIKFLATIALLGPPLIARKCGVLPQKSGTIFC